MRDRLGRLALRALRWRPLRARSVPDALLIGLGRFLRWAGLFLLYVAYWQAHPWLFKGFWRLQELWDRGLIR